MPDLAIRIATTPVGQPRQRHRIARRRGPSGKPQLYVQNYTPRTDKAVFFKRDLELALRSSDQCPPEPWEGPLRVDLLILLPRPDRITFKRKPNPRLWHTSKPDKDNLEKAIFDALSGHLWADDKQICAGETLCVVAAGHEPPGVELKVTKLDGVDPPQPFDQAESGLTEDQIAAARMIVSDA
jgi:Holliday junction resolvase RusA-like endonuclease